MTEIKTTEKVGVGKIFKSLEGLDLKPFENTKSIGHAMIDNLTTKFKDNLIFVSISTDLY